MNNKILFIFTAILFAIFIYSKYQHNKEDIPHRVMYQNKDAILPPEYYLYPTFNHLRPVRQRGEYFYFPQASRF